MKRKALVLGGTGFVGHHLLNQLQDCYDVHLCGRERDIRDKASLNELVSGVCPDVVVNLAAITTVRETVEDPRSTYDIGFTGLLNLLETLSQQGFTGRFLQVSSSEVYGHPDQSELPLTETSPLRPMSPYAVAKVAGEMLCFQWSQTAGFPIFVARPFTHIGPGQSSRFAVARFIEQIVQINNRVQEPVITTGSLQATRDLTDVRDVVRAYDAILHQGRSGAIYNVCSAQEICMRDVLEELIRLSQLEITIVEDNALMRKAEQQRLRGSFEALAADTGWKPKINLNQTLKDTLASALNG